MEHGHPYPAPHCPRSHLFCLGCTHAHHHSPTSTCVNNTSISGVRDSRSQTGLDDGSGECKRLVRKSKAVQLSQPRIFPARTHPPRHGLPARKNSTVPNPDVPFAWKNRSPKLNRRAYAVNASLEDTMHWLVVRIDNTYPLFHQLLILASTQLSYSPAHHHGRPPLPPPEQGLRRHRRRLVSTVG